MVPPMLLPWPPLPVALTGVRRADVVMGDVRPVGGGVGVRLRLLLLLLLLVGALLHALLPCDWLRGAAAAADASAASVVLALTPPGRGDGDRPLPPRARRPRRVRFSAERGGGVGVIMGHLSIDTKVVPVEPRRREASGGFMCVVLRGRPCHFVSFLLFSLQLLRGTRGFGGLRENAVRFISTCSAPPHSPWAQVGADKNVIKVDDLIPTPL
jgi:hypothetical protein